MTGEEKRKQLKEQFKRDLKLKKEFLAKAKKLRQMQNINKALGDLESQTKDDSDDLIAQLNQETALTEAKLEMAMDEAHEQQKKLEMLAKEAEMAKISAMNMVDEMKKEMGLSTQENEKLDKKIDNRSEKSVSTSDDDSADNPSESSNKKTMGDW